MTEVVTVLVPEVEVVEVDTDEEVVVAPVTESVLVDDPPATITVTNIETQTVELPSVELLLAESMLTETVEIGIAGPQGIQGPQGVAGPTGGVVVRERATGAIDGVNTVFTSSAPFVAQSLGVYLNGLLLDPPDDYAVSGADEVTFTDPPLAGDTVLMTYMEA